MLVLGPLLRLRQQVLTDQLVLTRPLHVENLMLVVAHLTHPPDHPRCCTCSVPVGGEVAVDSDSGRRHEIPRSWVAAPPGPPANGPRSQRACEEIRNTAQVVFVVAGAITKVARTM